MKIVHGLEWLRDDWQGCVATLGNFDGIHVGHQTILTRLQTLAKLYHLPSVVITFEPHPKVFLRPTDCPKRLMSLREKAYALQAYHPDYICVIPFRAHFAAMSPEQFVQDILLHRFKIKHMVVGEDVHFGRRGAGDRAYLERCAQDYHFTVECSPTLEIRQRRVSSTWLREVLSTGDLETAEHLLGQPYFMCGRVVRGNGLATQLGFPTANIALQDRQSVLLGVFVVELVDVHHSRWYGVANIGWRPTISGKHLSLEVHILDFCGDMYHKRLQVRFLHKLRDEKKFASLEALAAQIAHDVQQTRLLLR